MVNKKYRLAGRFLPSRVYARWTWTVRSGLCAVPLILFLAGGLALYLKPKRYASTVEFEYLGSRPLVEVEALLKSRNVLQDAVRDNELAKVLGADMDTAVDVASGSLKTQLDPVSGMFKVTVTLTLKEMARDLAASLPGSLEEYEIELASQETSVRLDAAEKFLKGFEEDTDDRQQILSKIIATRGEQAADSIGRLDVDAARSDWEYSHERLLEARSRVMEIKRELEYPRKWVTIHSQPQISQNAIDDKGEELFGVLVLRALGTGLAFALAVPYLLELAFPRRHSRQPARWVEMSEMGFERLT